MRPMRCALAFFVLCLWSIPVSAETLDQLLAKNLAARGGAAKLREIKSVRITGRVRFGSGDFSIEAQSSQVLRRGPSATRTEFTLQGLTQVRAYDGKEGWTVSPFGGRRDAEKASADDVRAMAHEADIEGPLVDWRAKGHRVEYLGTEDVDGTPAHKVRVMLKDGDIEYVFIDPDSALEIRTTTVHKVRGAEDITESDLG